MPTRIVLNKSSSPSRRRALSSTPPARPAPNFGSAAFPAASSSVDSRRRLAFLGDGPIDVSPNGSATTAARGPKPRRTVIDLRSSLLRELKSVQFGDIENSEFSQEEEVQEVRLSSDDIRASPRLMGYLFAMVAGVVQLISVYLFYREEILYPIDYIPQINATADNSDQEGIIFHDKYYATGGGLVFRWKVWAAIYHSAAAVAICLLTLVVHFETFAFPNVWARVFRDGSLGERNWILFLILVWGTGIHVETSVLSVGEYQANVYFTAWIGFAAMALNYGVWYESAGHVSWQDKVNSYHRETTYNWIWTGIFSCIFAGAATDIYYNRDDVVLRYRGQQLDLDGQDWVLILSIIWMEVGICIMAVVFNESFHSFSCRFPCRLHRRDGVYRFVFGWRQLEGVIILVSMGAKFWTILEYTGFGGVVNGLSNAYFGIWGSFFNSVFAFGTWLRENKNLESFVREAPPTDAQNWYDPAAIER